MDGKISRRKARENAFITLFSTSFGAGLDETIAVAREQQDEYAVDAFGEGVLKLYETHASAVDEVVEANLKDWKLSRLPRVSLALLRVSVAEMLYGEPEMDSVIINEAVELSKRFGDEGDYQFINGVLGSVSRAKKRPEESESKSVSEETV